MEPHDIISNINVLIVRIDHLCAKVDSILEDNNLVKEKSNILEKSTILLENRVTSLEKQVSKLEVLDPGILKAKKWDKIIDYVIKGIITLGLTSIIYFLSKGNVTL